MNSAFAVVLKRKDEPKLCKVVGEKFHLVREDAEKVLNELDVKVRKSFEVREIFIHFDNRLYDHVTKFVDSHHIECAETIYQVDDVILDAYEFIEGCCEIVGYKK